jgi:hypothetical protein
MMFIRFNTQRCPKYFHALILGGVLLIPTLSSAEGISHHNSTGVGQKHEDTQLRNGHRSIEGIVEEINKNTIRVNAGDAGDISPRYLNFHKNIGDAEIHLGDTLQIEVNPQNEVIRYQKIAGSTEKKM